MTHRLDSLFKAPSVLGKDASPDMSGLIGQYVHGNEPSHHIIYLYTMSGQPWKTADKVREILEGQYHAAPDGLSGNEDVGQMSAWYILTAMGFYNVEPASTKYWFGSPIFDKVSIVVSKDGKTKFDINTVNNSKENKYTAALNRKVDSPASLKAVPSSSESLLSKSEVLRLLLAPLPLPFPLLISPS